MEGTDMSGDRRRRARRLGSVVVAVSLVLSPVQPAGSTPALAADPQPIAHWALDEGGGSVATDSGSGAYDATLTSTAWITDGQDDGALRFNGTTSGAVADAAMLTPESLTIAMWVRAEPGGRPTTGSVILERGGRVDCDDPAWGVYAKQTTFAFGWRDAASGEWSSIDAFSTEGVDLWDGDWHHIAVATSTQPYVYVFMSIDGFSSSFVVDSPAFAYDDLVQDTIAFGHAANGCSNPGRFRGDMDDVRIYGSQLSLDEIGGLLPPITTTTLISGPTTVAAQASACYQTTVSPAPNGGAVTIVVRRSGGSDTSFDSPWLYAGTSNICLSLHAATYTIQTEFSGRRPWLASTSPTITLEVEKLETTAWVSGRSPQLSSEPFAVSAVVDGDGEIATGSVDLFEMVDGDRVAIGSAPLEYTGTNSVSIGRFSLPARPAGTYEFEMEYAGDVDHLPASGSGVLTVVQDVVPGTLTINGGALVTTTPFVTIDAPAQAASRLVVSNGNQLYKTFDPYQPTVPWSLTDPQFGGNSAEGLKTVYVRWYNEYNEDTDDHTATIYYDTSAPTGDVAMNGGAALTSNSVVDLDVTATDAGSYVTDLQVSNDGETWATRPYQPTISWDLANTQFGGSTAGGSKTVHVRWRDLAGHWSSEATDTIELDSIAPAATSPRLEIVPRSTVSGGKPTVRFDWSGSDVGTGIDRYEFALSTDGGGYASLGTAIATTSLLSQLSPGHTYRARVRPVDEAGNSGAWAYGSSIKLAAYQDSSSAITWTGTWRTASSDSFWGGHDRYATATGAKATLTFTGRTVAWVGSVGPAQGTAQIYVNGTLVTSVDLSAARPFHRRTLFAASWPTTATRTVTIRVVGTAGHPRVDVDALIVGS